MTAADEPAGPGRPEELGAPLAGQRVRTRATRPPVDPRLLRLDPAVGRQLVVTAVLALVTAAALIAQATSLGAIVARSFLGGASLAEHRGWLAVLVGAVLVRAVAAWLTDVVAQHTAARVKSRLRRAVVDQLTGRPPAAGERTTGELASALTEGIDALDGTFGGYLPALVTGVVIPLAIVGWLVPVELTSALILAVTLPLIPLFMVLVGLAARAATRARFRALTALSGHLLTVLEGLATIRLAGATVRLGRVVHDAAERLRRTTLETLRIAFLSALVLELLAALAVATVAVVAGVRLAEGTGVGFEPVLVALLLAPEAFWPLRRVGQQFHANEDGAAAAEMLLELLEPDPSAPTTGADPQVPDPAVTAVRLEDIVVRYPGGRRPALCGVSLTLAAGEQTVLLGSSGAGKTTLGLVLLGLTAPTSGRVTVGGRALSELDGAGWHDRLAWVPQDPAPLRGTVRELVLLGAPGRVDDTTVWAALAEVGLDAEVTGLPEGLDTLVGPGARGLSAGQRRRLALARALLRPAGLLVLDEPTGDLDVDAERAVRTALDRLRGQRTVLVLTHRMALAAGADRLVVLDAGRVVEQGVPAELATAGGPTASLVAAAAPLTAAELDVAKRVMAPPVRGLAAAVEPAAAPPELGAPPEPGSADPPMVDASAGPLALLRGLLSPHRRPLAVAVAAGAVTPLAGVVLVAVSTYLISESALQPNLLDLTAVIVSVRGLSLLKGVSRYVERLAGHDVALRVVVGLRAHTYRQLVRQAPAGLARHRVGDVLARVVTDVDRLQLALVRGVVPLLGGLLASLVVVAIAGWLLPAAAPVALLGLATAGLGVPAVAWLLARGPERELARVRGELTTELVDVLRSAPELRLLGELGPATDRLVERDAELTRLDRSAVARGGGSDALVALTLGAMLVGLVLVGVPAVVAGTLDGVLLGALVVLALGANEAVGPLPAAASAMATATSAARRLGEVLDAPDPTPDPAVTQALPGPESPLVVAAASARYPGSDAPALTGVDLVVAPGQVVVVVGRSGAGKSTLTHLGVRFLDPVAGVVELGGTPLTRLAGAQVRSRVTLATQRAELFAGSLATNLRLAAPDADDATLHDALRAAQLDGWVAELPDGLATDVGERGTRLSGGQRQRVALARTLLHGAPLLLVDEPTAELDTVTGRRFLTDLVAAAGARGLVVLTHDLRLLPVADEVVVLEDGQVAARGRHEQLLAGDPGYAGRWRLDQDPVAALTP